MPTILPVRRFSAATMFVLAVVTMPACAKGTDEAVNSDTAAATSPTDTGMAGMSHDDMAMTGDPDRDFLRMMSDHHAGIIAMAHPTMESKQNLSVKADARKIDRAQDQEIKQMTMMLQSDYQDSYTPKVTLDNQRMVDELLTKSGTEYDRTFLQSVIKHHEQALVMIDGYLPKSTKPVVRAMAEQMKSAQAKEIAEFNKKLGALKQ